MEKEQIIITDSPEKTKELAPKLLSTNYNLLTFKGQLGVGKTTLIQSLGEMLGIDRLTSPTFTIIKEYSLRNHPKFKTLYHIDLYRLSTREEVLDLGIEEMWSNPHNLVLIEWPEIVEDKLPSHLEVLLEIAGSDKRKITITNPSKN